ncbi:unnamed protein product [Rangifer tarandus platyrhynchus]|uniref:Uncharacterized protein n=2 Tax=Rangifer tarandus platyrhynchus TaxID=3082113 RepID=A0ACB0F6V6_RANTA|nr:unnamed protein product [Rangifer tarandus platyrhynchus]CAI9708228.1 unnamed protein product [Rangifer tarandus platyrhynchus]
MHTSTAAGQPPGLVRKRQDRILYPRNLKDRFLGLSPLFFPWKPTELPRTPGSPMAPRADATHLPPTDPSAPQHLSTDDRVRMRLYVIATATASRVRRAGGTWAGLLGGAGRGEGEVTCCPPPVEGRGLGAVGPGGLRADSLLLEQPEGCGRLRAPAGKEGQVGLVGRGRMRALAKPGTAGHGAGGDAALPGRPSEGARPLADPLTWRWASVPGRREHLPVLSATGRMVKMRRKQVSAVQIGTFQTTASIAVTRKDE